MSFPQLGYPQFLNVPHELYGAERPASAREGGTEGGVGSSSSGAVGSVLGVYGSPWAHGYSAFLPYSGAADLALISQMGSQYELKDGPSSHPASLPVHAAQGFYPYGQYPYGDPARAKTATRETTSTLKAWLQEHQKNPYPTKGEKIMLAIITRMTLTQVSTWFANARRRLKKENKVTWGRSAEDRDGRIFSSDNEDEPGKHGSDEEEEEEEEEEIDLETVDIERPVEEAQSPGREEGEPGEPGEERAPGARSPEGGRTRTRSPEAGNKPPAARSPRAEECARPSQSKPKIWSLAETATTPDSARRPHARPLGHGIYACQIGKLHNWANAALLNASSILNMRSLLGGHMHAQHAEQHAEQHAAPAPAARNDARPPAGHLPSGTEEDSDVESTGSFSPKRDDEESDHRPDSLKSSFQLITDRSHHGTASQRVLTSTL